VLLAADRDHVVLAIFTDHVAGVRLCLLADEAPLADPYPALFPASSLELVSPEVPPSWRVSVGHNGRPDSIVIAPEPWLHHRFFWDYWDDEHPEAQRHARELFDREVELIMRES
jgi:hypothetical protein